MSKDISSGSLQTLRSSFINSEGAPSTTFNSQDTYCFYPDCQQRMCVCVCVCVCVCACVRACASYYWPELTQMSTTFNITL